MPVRGYSRLVRGGSATGAKVTAERKETEWIYLRKSCLRGSYKINSQSCIVPPSKFVQLVLGIADSRFNAELADVIMYQLMCEIYV